MPLYDLYQNGIKVSKSPMRYEYITMEHHGIDISKYEIKRPDGNTIEFIYTDRKDKYLIDYTWKRVNETTDL